MGINSTEVAYGFGQMGSLFNDGTAACTPPTFLTKSAAPAENILFNIL